MRFSIPQGLKRLKGVYLEIRLVLLARVSNNVFIVVLLRKEIERAKFGTAVTVFGVIILFYGR